MERYREQAQLLANYLPSGKFWTAKNYSKKTTEKKEVFTSNDYSIVGNPVIDSNGVMTYQSANDNIVVTRTYFDVLTNFYLKFGLKWNGETGYLANVDAKTFYSIYTDGTEFVLKFYQQVYDENTEEETEDEIEEDEEETEPVFEAICETVLTLDNPIKAGEKFYIRIGFDSGYSSIAVNKLGEDKQQTIQKNDIESFEPAYSDLHIGYDNITELDLKEVVVLENELSKFNCIEEVEEEVLDESDLRKLLNAFGKEFVNIEDSIYWLKRELNIKTTHDLIGNWEAMYGIPDGDGIFTIENKTIEERRQNLLIKEYMNGVDTCAEWEYLAKQFGYNVKVQPCTETSVTPTTDPRYNIVVTFLDFQPASEFTLTFPITFGGVDVSLLKKVFKIIKPANCVIIYS